MSKRVTKRKAAREFACASALAALCIFILLFNIQQGDTSEPHAWISGPLQKWELYGRQASPSLRLRLEDKTPDFVVDIVVFREAMNREIPPGLVPGARVSVLVQEKQYAHPLRTRIGPSAQIVWVRGLRVGGKEIFGPAAVRSWKERNNQWGYAMTIASLAFAAYMGVRWRRARTSWP